MAFSFPDGAPGWSHRRIEEPARRKRTPRYPVTNVTLSSTGAVGLERTNRKILSTNCFHDAFTGGGEHVHS
jgi:hypothetical protein